MWWEHNPFINVIKSIRWISECFLIFLVCLRPVHSWGHTALWTSPFIFRSPPGPQCWGSSVIRQRSAMAAFFSGVHYPTKNVSTVGMHLTATQPDYMHPAAEQNVYSLCPEKHGSTAFRSPNSFTWIMKALGKVPWPLNDPRGGGLYSQCYHR